MKGLGLYYIILSVSPVFVLSSLDLNLNPVILIPGDGGSQFKAKLNKPKVVHWYCWKKTDYYYDIWLSMEQILPVAIFCFVDNMRLEYDRVTRSTNNSPGVDIMVPGFGETETVEWLDADNICFTSYYHDIANSMVQWGYKRNVSLSGAPYDFRKAPNELKDFLTNFKSLIEETYLKNNNNKVVLVGHSMGNPITLHLLNQLSDEWKNKYIKSFISLAGVWGGAAKSLRLMITGDNLDVPFVDPFEVRREQRSFPSTAWLMPSDEFWNGDEVLVQTPFRNYTIKDYKQLFEDIGYPNGYFMWEDTVKLNKPLKAPGVEMHCLHGDKVPTPKSFIYKKENWLEEKPTTLWDNGDGTVNIRSLLGCLRFREQQKQTVYHQTFNHVDHMHILKNKDVIEYLKKVLIGQKDTVNKLLRLYSNGTSTVCK